VEAGAAGAAGALLHTWLLCSLAICCFSCYITFVLTLDLLVLQVELATPEGRSALHTMGAAGLVAFVDVYDSLEVAAKVVFAQSAEATTQYITYK